MRTVERNRPTDTLPAPTPGASRRRLHEVLDELLDAGDGVSPSEGAAFLRLARLEKGGPR